MRSGMQRNHMIDFLFPIALFFVFAVSAIVVIMLAANIYETTTETSALHDTSRTSLAYVSEKVHQNDTGGGISLGEFDGCDALVIDHRGDLEGYTTYIYVYENQLKEMLAADDAVTSAASGKTIMENSSLEMRQLDDGLFRFSCMDTAGREVSTIVGIRSDR